MYLRIETVVSDFSKFVDLETLLAREVTVKPAKTDYAKLAARIDVPAVLDFNATFRGMRESPGIIRLKGKLNARLQQECVRTLTPIETIVKDNFSIILLQADAAEKYLTEQDEETLEDIEILSGDAVDLGEIATQYLSLAIDRFPVKKDTELKNPMSGNLNIISESEDKKSQSPFAVLKNLNKKA